MSQRLPVVVFALLLCALPAHAQIPGINLNLGARVGYFKPLGSLADTPFEVEVSSGLGLGAHLELDLPLSPINVRANVAATLGRSLSTDGDEDEGSDLDIVVITGDLVFRPLPRVVVVQPYLLAGAGVKRYSFDFNGENESESKFTGHVGAGADLKVGPIALLAEVSDYISSFELAEGGGSKLQNDVFVSIGFRIGML